MRMTAIEKAIDLLGDILVDLEMTTVDPGAYIDCAKEKAKKAIAALEAEKPAEDARSLAIDISLGALDRAEFWEVIVPKRIHNFAHSYHLAKCAKCRALTEDDVSERIGRK